MTRSLARLRDFFALDDPWERPGGSVARRDLVLGVALAVLAAVSLELVRGGGVLREVTAPVWVQQLVTVAGALLLVGRRRWPLLVATTAAAHMFVVGLTMPTVMAQFLLQVVYAVAIFSGVAWARSRSSAVLVVGGIVAFMFGWILVTFAVGRTLEQEYALPPADQDPAALLGPISSAVLLVLLVNVLFFGAAIGFGQASWRRARDRARLTEQASTIRRQADRLRDQAVVEERLRIARELHDVVAHHVSVIGIHAAAGRRVMERDPDAARSALAQVEESTRDAVGQMRGLLGALREIESSQPTDEAGRRPAHGLADLPRLVGSRTTPRLAVDYTVAEEPPGCLTDVPPPQSLALYRTVQEALTNTTRHSTATVARVALRVRATVDGRQGYAEVEVTDDGRPRGLLDGVAGSGMGQLGIRERAGSFGGSAEIGPRQGGGYRVRVRLPLAPEASAAASSGRDPSSPDRVAAPDVTVSS